MAPLAVRFGSVRARYRGRRLESPNSEGRDRNRYEPDHPRQDANAIAGGWTNRGSGRYRDAIGGLRIQFGQAEIQNLGVATLRNENIRGLNVAVHNSQLVGGIQTVADLGNESTYSYKLSRGRNWIVTKPRTIRRANCVVLEATVCARTSCRRSRPHSMRGARTARPLRSR
jgi:hypothetical protein